MKSIFSISFIVITMQICGTVPASAAEKEAMEVAGLVQSGQYAAAQVKLGTYLRLYPRDPHLRFFRAVVLAEQHQAEQAMDEYTRLIQDFPEMPEPYNNLAVLLTASGQYDKAHAAFETATRLNRNYAIAHENLGDLYARMALRAYGRSMSIDRNAVNVRGKASVINTLIADAEGERSQSTDSAVISANKTALAAATSKLPSELMPPIGVLVAQAKPAFAAVPVAARETVRPSDVQTMVDAWLHAWNARDVGSYLQFYARDFATPNGESRGAWERKRRERIASKARISVSISSPQIIVGEGRATVSFVQDYRSDRFAERSSKTLELVKREGQWRIVRERSDS